MGFEKERAYYSYEYWFNNSQLNEWDNGDENYYVNYFYDGIVKNLDVPKEGKIVVLGTHMCVSFDKLCKHFGYDRCIGYDMHNPTNHPNIVTKDCSRLSEEDDIPIAFCHNDLGNFPTTPELKLHGQEWALRNIIDGGYFLGNTNRNSADINLESLMENNGFKNIFLKDLNQEKFDLSNIPALRLLAYMVSKKKGDNGRRKIHKKSADR
jgi:hypothetical protein